MPEYLAGQSEACPSCGNVAVVPQPAAPFQPPVVPRPVAQQPTQVMVNVKGPKATSGLGIAALVLGILACLTCWIPFVGMLSIPLSVLGILFGGIGFLVSLVGRRSGVGMPIAGLIVCVVAVVIAVVSTGGTSAAISDAMREADRKRSATHQEVVSSPGTTSPPVTPAARPAPAKLQDENWASASSPVKQGDVQIRIVSARVDKVQIKDSFGDGTSPSKDALLAVTVEVTNLSQTKKLDYRTWAGADFALGRDFAALADNFGNSYKRITFGMDKPVGRIDRDSIYPGKALTDVLVFEEPIESAEDLRLELPGENFNGTGMIRFQIPASMILRGHR